MSSSNKQPRIPGHIALIMDGNGRWARRRGLPRSAGHQQGVKALRECLSAIHKHGVGHVTLYAFSSENWQRPEREIKLLMDLFQRSLRTHISELHSNNIRLYFIGRRDRLQTGLVQEMENCEQLTATNTGPVINVAIDYSGQWDIRRAAGLAAREQAGDPPSGLRLERYLSLAGQPAVDLLIRTGGECRLSNFLLWQLAYTELYFTDVLWPDFNAAHLREALDFFSTRDRRFGRVTSAVSDAQEDDPAARPAAMSSSA